jgi:hypothetical protein
MILELNTRPRIVSGVTGVRNDDAWAVFASLPGQARQSHRLDQPSGIATEGLKILAKTEKTGG